MSMNAKQARVVDPILTNHARGYVNADMIGRFLFPTVTMPTRAAKRIEFDRSSFKRRRTRRAPGSPILTLEYGYEGKAVALHQEALSAVTPIEFQAEADEVPSIDLQQLGVDTVLAVIALEKETREIVAFHAKAAIFATGGSRRSSQASRRSASGSSR